MTIMFIFFKCHVCEYATNHHFNYQSFQFVCVIVLFA